jgi:hypothetical protein
MDKIILDLATSFGAKLRWELIKANWVLMRK